MQVFIMKTLNVHVVLECRTFYTLMYTPVDFCPQHAASCTNVFLLFTGTQMRYSMHTKSLRLKLVIPTVSVSSHDQTKSLFRIQFHYGLVKVRYYELVQNCASELQIKVTQKNIQHRPLCAHNVEIVRHEIIRDSSSVYDNAYNANGIHHIEQRTHTCQWLPTPMTRSHLEEFTDAS